MEATKLDSLYDMMQKLTPASSTEEYDAFGAFFDENCTVWLKSMREWAEPSIGRYAVIDTLKESLTQVHIDERRVLSQSMSPDGSILFCEMKNRLNVLGDTLDPFFETAVVKFNDKGLIVDLKLYSKLFVSKIVPFISQYQWQIIYNV